MVAKSLVFGTMSLRNGVESSKDISSCSRPDEELQGDIKAL